MSNFRTRYQTIEFNNKTDIHIRSLRDKQEFSDPLGEAQSLGISSAQWSLFGVVWASSKVLAREMECFNIKGKRILEVGCGIALSSLLLKSRDADITATDYHPETAAFLVENTKLNNCGRIPFLCTNWSNVDDGLGLFDVIIGADLLYEQQHIDLLSDFIHRHAKQHCEIRLVDPGRRHHAAFSKKMVRLGYSHSQYRPKPELNEKTPFKGHVLQYIRGVS
ncbi:MAG: class I SAM-dependent methyltransferase [Arenicella sp.]